MGIYIRIYLYMYFIYAKKRFRTKATHSYYCTSQVSLKLNCSRFKGTAGLRRFTYV